MDKQERYDIYAKCISDCISKIRIIHGPGDCIRAYSYINQALEIHAKMIDSKRSVMYIEGSTYQQELDRLIPLYQQKIADQKQYADEFLDECKEAAMKNSKYEELTLITKEDLVKYETKSEFAQKLLDIIPFDEAFIHTIQNRLEAKKALLVIFEREIRIEHDCLDQFLGNTARRFTYIKKKLAC